MEENLRRFLGLRWDSPRQQLAFRFEIRWLRYAAYVSLLGVPFLWWTLAYHLGDRWPGLVPAWVVQAAKAGTSWAPPIEVALALFWPILLSVTAYYGHLVFRRFQLSLLAFMGLVLLWGHSTAIIWVSARWVAGLTMFLAAGALLGYAIAWGQSVARFCDLRGKPAYVGLVVLGALTPVAFFALLFGFLLFLLAAFNSFIETGWVLSRGVFSVVFGLLVLIPAFWLTRRCRLAAREVLAADSTTTDASTDATPTETEPPVLGQRAHAAWLVLHKRRWPLMLVMIFCGGFVLYISLVARGISLARRNEPISLRAYLALAPSPVPDAENAAVLWRDAFAATTGKAFKALQQDWHDKATYAAGGVSRTLLAASAKAYSLADKAADRERCGWDLKYEDLFGTRLPHLGPMRELGYQMAMRARVAAYDGNWATVHRSLRTMCAGADDLVRDPILINYMVANAIEARATESIETVLSTPGAAPTEKDIRQLEELARERLRLGYKMSDALHGERELCLAQIDRMVARRFRTLIYSDLKMITNNPGMLKWHAIFYAGDREALKVGINAIIEEVEDAIAGEPLLSAKVIWPPQFRFPHILTSYYLGSFNRMPEQVVQRKLGWRLALLGLAVKRYALAHGDAWPASLDELGFEAPDLLDPFDPDGKYIRYRIDKDGSALLWSVGLNRKDDGGDPTPGRYGDIVFRLYAPAGTE